MLVEVDHLRFSKNRRKSSTCGCVLAKPATAIADALKSPDVTDKLRAGDQTVVGSTPAQAAATLAADSKKWGEVARRIKLGLD